MSNFFCNFALQIMYLCEIEGVFFHFQVHKKKGHNYERAASNYVYLPGDFPLSGRRDAHPVA